MQDTIEIKGLRVSTFIGVPDEEREVAQELEISLLMTPEKWFEDSVDDINATVDYYQVALGVEQVAMERPRKLIETLAEDVAAFVLKKFAVERVNVKVDKFIIPNAKSVAVRIIRPPFTNVFS